MKPSATLPKQFDVCRETQVALIAGRIRQAQVLVFEVALPPGVQYALKAVYVEVPGKTVAYGTYNLSIPDGTGRVYQNVTDRAVYDLRNIRAISPSHEKRGFLPRLLLWLRLVHAAANSLSGSWARMRPSSLFAKLSR